MAEYRTIQTKLWRDEWYSGLDCESRLLWIYFITNDAASVAGIYRLAERYIVFETGISQARVREIMKSFKAAGRIDFEGDVIWIKKMREYQESRSPKVQARIIKDVRAIPACRVKSAYCKKYGIDAASVEPYGIYTVSIPDRTDTETETETETDTETETESVPATPAAPAGNPSKSTEAQKADAYHPALVVYRDVYDRFPAKAVWETIIGTVGDAPAGLKLYREVLKDWALCNYSPVNFAGQLDWFKAGGKPARHPARGRQNGRSTVAEAFDLVDQIAAEQAARSAN